MKAVLVISHGSHSSKTKDEVESLIGQLKAQNAAAIVEYGFLEISSPSIPEGITNCIKQGASEVNILLNFLNSGKHVNEDIPRIVSEAQSAHPNVKMIISPPVGQHKGIVDLFLEMIPQK